jgi:hypothetical protein
MGLLAARLNGAFAIIRCGKRNRRIERGSGFILCSAAKTLAPV